jgi:hypothetical protein
MNAGSGDKGTQIARRQAHPAAVFGSHLNEPGGSFVIAQIFLRRQVNTKIGHEHGLLGKESIVFVLLSAGIETGK